MSLFTWAEDGMKNMRWYDLSLVKLSTAAFVLMIVVLWPPLASLEWYWYLAIGIIAAIRPMMLFFQD